ncbi:hypothetical protein MLD38_019829 [Melastoma candidum]|uniref:Uncharacterized protein n=1 Tax=Melastoma candidum TaxID=119954 RepID=A0ACB9QJ01_9MYRT|nr:hypothetical protein MLD38_019829 [Melastoma candidum]
MTMLDAGNIEGGRCFPGRRDRARVSFLLICVVVGFMGLAKSGWQANLIVYLIDEFNFEPIVAAQIYNVVNGCMCFLPIIAAVVADSYFGCFPVASVSSLISFLGIVIISLTATLVSLRPHQCTAGSSTCDPPSKIQSATLYVGITLSVLGVGGSVFTMTTLGANQFDNEKQQGAFFNWSFFCQGQSHWLRSFLIGHRCYRHIKPQGSPFTSLACVLVAALRKRKLPIPSDSNAYYSRIQEKSKGELALIPREKFGFLNRAAIKMEGDVNSDGMIVKRWRLCTVQQVEDLKMLIGVSPLWLSSILLSTPVAVQNSMTVLQALTVNRRLGSSFEIPAGSVLVLIMFSATIWLTVIDPLVESKRLHTSSRSNPDSTTVSMSVIWLFPQLILVGIGEAFHFPGQLSFFYREFPESLKSSATAIVGAIIGIAYFVSIGSVDMFRTRTTWLRQDLDKGRLDLVYWVLAAIGLTNFGYFLACACMYKSTEKADDAVAASGANLNGKK